MLVSKKRREADSGNTNMQWVLLSH